jgi:type IV secretory pathway VirB10-like protein
MEEQAKLPDQEKDAPKGAIPKKYWKLIGVGMFALVAVIILCSGGSTPTQQPAQNLQQTRQATPPNPQQIAAAKLAMDQQIQALREAEAKKREMEALTAAIQHGSSPEMAAVKAQNAAMVNSQTAALSDQRRYYGGGGYNPQPAQNQKQEEHKMSSSIVFDIRDKEKQETVKPEEPKAEQAGVKKVGLLDADPSRPTYVLPEGTVIEAVLTNKIEGANSGPVNCQVSTPVYAPGTRKVLFPQGARFLGSASAVSALGQERLAVTFHRVTVGTGAHMYAISLQAPGLDQQGAMALKDQVNNHWMSTIGISLAVGGIAGLSQIGNQGYSYGAYDPTVQIRNGITSSVAQQSVHILDRLLNRMPTVTIRPGTRVKIALLSDITVPAYEEESL